MSTGPYPPVPQPSRPFEPGIPQPAWNGGYPPASRPHLARPRRRIWVHLLLFGLTVLSTWLMQGAAYSVCLLTILTAHEFGHYFAARHYRVKATLPYFIPFPSLFGTLGAVIRMSPYIPNRRALFDIAAAGPIAGLIVAIPVSFVGIAMSEQVVQQGREGLTITLGDPLLFRAMEWVIFGSRQENMDLMLHNVAFAGWVGLFITALNLLPISQLDGGHINYAIFGRRGRFVAAATFGTLAVVTFFQGYHYVLILVLLWFMGINHPPTLNDDTGLGRRRRLVGIALAVVFVLCFVASPVQM